MLERFWKKWCDSEVTSYSGEEKSAACTAGWGYILKLNVEVQPPFSA
jgi:hypothetical protein